MSQYDAQETAGKAEEDELPTVQKVAILMVWSHWARTRRDGDEVPLQL